MFTFADGIIRTKDGNDFGPYLRHYRIAMRPDLPVAELEAQCLAVSSKTLSYGGLKEVEEFFGKCLEIQGVKSIIVRETRMNVIEHATSVYIERFVDNSVPMSLALVQIFTVSFRTFLEEDQDRKTKRDEAFAVRREVARLKDALYVVEAEMEFEAADELITG